MIFNTRLGRFHCWQRLDLARPIEEINSALRPIFELIFFFLAVLYDSILKVVITEANMFEQELDLEVPSVCLFLEGLPPYRHPKSFILSTWKLATSKTSQATPAVSEPHWSCQRGEILKLGLSKMLDQTNIFAQTCKDTTGAWIAGTCWRAGCILRATEKDLDGILGDFYSMSLTLKLNIDKGPAHHLLRCYTTLGSRTPGQSSPLERFLVSSSMEIGWSGSRDERGDSKSLSGHPWCGWSEAISFWIWQGRPLFHCRHFSWKKLKSHHHKVHLLGILHQDLDVTEMRDFVAAFREGTLKARGFRDILSLLTC